MTQLTNLAIKGFAWRMKEGLSIAEVTALLSRSDAILQVESSGGGLLLQVPLSTVPFGVGDDVYSLSPPLKPEAIRGWRAPDFVEMICVAFTDGRRRWFGRLHIQPIV